MIKRRSRARTLLREQERETVTEVITKKVIVVEEPVEEVTEEVIEEEEPLQFDEDTEAADAWTMRNLKKSQSSLAGKYGNN